MHWRNRPLPWTLALLLPLACKEPEVAAVQNRAQQAQAALAEARAHLANGQPAPALAAVRRAATAAPDSSEPYLLMADAQRMSNNIGAAIMALKQAEALIPGTDPSIQKQLADMYLGNGNIAEALSTLTTLRDSGLMTNEDVLGLARLQAKDGQMDAAFTTIEGVLRESPDDPEAKAVEAEVLLMKGDELLAANLMDKLLANNPAHTAARLLRARYFLVSGVPQMAEADLQAIEPKDANRADVVMLRARVLLALGRAADAEAALKPLVDSEPQNAEALAWMADTALAQGRRADALSLVDRALTFRPRLARALYVRGRAQEEQNDRKSAEESYRFALSAEPRFAPVHARLWRMYLEADRKVDAFTSLERLLDMGEASLEEKVVLARLSAQLQTQMTRGMKLIDEALKKDPENAEYQEVKKQLVAVAPKPKKKPGGPVIIRGGR
ncbi:tetratricopeptide repeat protein [Myxococcus stipitatus]|uniref:tetratricopeptide repeat protein n=1 Tax=Myxococcus stipitatus TaxID=83455 RepID=UPI001F15763E|nr:tetratricopeptide repeat protein [Myxococcus stipitatus]MCE9668079.1 tetratricopeptide repeat protein [Myxococcus stipitatus]